jgi:DNA segregation ATPase FtsK/SpoIIIE, S-DNA-T family
MLGDDDRFARWRLKRTSRNPLPLDALPLLGEHPDPDATVIDLDDDDIEEDTAEAPVHSHLPERPQPSGPLTERDRNPIIQKLWTDPVEAALDKLEFAWHVTLFHGARLHRYLGRAIAWTPRGIGRMVIGLWNWWTDSESAPLRHSTVQRGDVNGYMIVSRQRNERVHDRKWIAMSGIAVVLTAPFLSTGLMAAGLGAGQWALVGLGAALALSYVGTAGWHGAPADRRLIEAATSEAGARRITGEMVRAAFEAARLSVPAQGKDIEFVRDVARVGRHGQEAVIDLPPGGTFEKAFKKRAEIASGLSVARVQVFMTSDSESERRMKIYVHDFDPYAKAPQVTPLAKKAKVDFWQPFPIGVDARGQTVEFSLIWTSFLIGSIPRQGKTNAARLPVAAAALDPTVRLIVFNGKGDRAWKPFEKIAHRYGSGVRDHIVGHLAAVLRECVADMDLRFERMSGLPDHKCPDDKVTPELTADRKLDMPLTVIAIDEVHRYLEHEQFGGDILKYLTELAKVGPSAGYMLVLATQKPDAKVMEDSLRGQMGTRSALKVMTWQASDTILGAGSYSAGLDASQFKQDHKGVAILLGADDNELSERGGQIVRYHLGNGQVMSGICDRAYQLRSRLGTLTGLAAGEDPMAEQTPYRLLDHILDCAQLGEEKVQSETLIKRMAESHPDLYDGWSPADLARALKPFAIETVQVNKTVNGQETNRRGVRFEDVVDALARRLGNGSTTSPSGA